VGVSGGLKKWEGGSWVCGPLWVVSSGRSQCCWAIDGSGAVCQRLGQWCRAGCGILQLDCMWPHGGALSVALGRVAAGERWGLAMGSERDFVGASVGQGR